MSPSDRVAQLYPQAPGSLSVACYHSQGYGGGILTRLLMGYMNIFKPKISYHHCDVCMLEEGYGQTGLSLDSETMYIVKQGSTNPGCLVTMASRNFAVGLRNLEAAIVIVLSFI
jgi:hypothetical protein